MTLNAHAIALWVGILGSAAGVYFPIHSELKQNQTDETTQATQRQQRIDALNQRLVNDETAIQILATQLPAEQQHMLNIIRDVQKQAQSQPQVVMFEKSSVSADAPTSMEHRMDRPEVIADRPKVEIPEEPLTQPKE